MSEATQNGVGAGAHGGRLRRPQDRTHHEKRPPEEPGALEVTETESLEVHASAVGHRRHLLLLRLVRDDRLGREEQSCDRGCVLQP